MTRRIHLETSGVFKLVEGLLKKQAESQLPIELETLKQLLEAGSE